MIISTLDYLIGFVYLLLIYAFLFVHARKYKSKMVYRHFIWGFTVKAVGAIAVGLIYLYYYGYGDTFAYFGIGKFFGDLIQKEPGEIYNVLVAGDTNYFNLKGFQYGFSSWYAFNPATIIMARFCTLFNYFTFGLYLPTALCFALFSFSGVWQLYKVFTDQFPTLRREFGFFILFIPSVFFWGSGILKDTVTMGALGWLTWAIYSIFIKKQQRLKGIIVTAISFYLLFQIKAYIAVAYIPAAVAWALFNFTKTARNDATKKLLILLFLISIVIGGVVITNFIGAEMQQVSVEDIIQQAATTRANISTLEASSAYSLGNFEPGFLGTLKIALPALIVTLYRPFIWEVKNPFSLLSALESSFFIWFTFFVMRTAGIKTFFRTFFSQPVVLFCLTFAIMFAVPVGIASGNFGTLVRYKIPCLPFYLIGLLIIYYKATGKSLFRT